MSRSAPTVNNPNPATRFLEWKGGKGLLSYYDKEAKKTVEIGDQFTFLVLDSLATIKGFHKKTDAGIYSNEVRDTRNESLLVKTFKGLVIADGFYGSIKDRCFAVGGKYTTSLYIAFKGDDGKLALGNLAINGAALGPWIEFTKGKRVDLDTKAVKISGSIDGQTGTIKYKSPIFSFVGVSDATNDEAIALDKELQVYLTAYLNRPTSAKAEREPDDDDQHNEEHDDPQGRGGRRPEPEPEDDDIPF